MSNEEKILTILSTMQTQMGQMQKQMDRIEERLDRIDARLDKAEDDLQRVRLYLELDVEKRFDAINVGIDVIQERLVPEKRIKKAEDDIVVLKTAVKALARDVAELKKAE